MARLTINAITCEDTQEARDEVYLKVGLDSGNPERIWGPRRMNDGDSLEVNWQDPEVQNEFFDCAIIQVWEKDIGRDDLIGQICVMATSHERQYRAEGHGARYRVSCRVSTESVAVCQQPIQLLRLHSNDVMGNRDNVYLTLNGRRIWGPVKMKTGDTQPIDHTVVISEQGALSLWEQNPIDSDLLGSYKFSWRRSDRRDALYTFHYLARTNDYASSNINAPFVSNIKDEKYGAVGNGFANDTSAIEAAIRDCKVAGGGIVFYPAGSYAIDKSIDDRFIEGSNDHPIFHLGQGKSTIIKACPCRDTENADKPPAFTMFTVGFGTGPRVFANMTLDGNKEQFEVPNNYNVGSGIYFDAQSENCGNAVQNVCFMNHHSNGVRSFGDRGKPYNLDEKYPLELIVDGCSFKSITGQAVYCYFLTSGGVWGCDFYDIDYDRPPEDTRPPAAAVSFNGCKDFTIARNRITKCRVGIAVGASASFSIIDNLVRDTEQDGIQASANLCLHPDSEGLGYPMSRRFICARNRVYNAGGSGITVDPQWFFWKKSGKNACEPPDDVNDIKVGSSPDRVGRLPYSG